MIASHWKRDNRDTFGEVPIWARPSDPETKVGTSLSYSRVVFIHVGTQPLGGFLEALQERLGAVQSPTRSPGALGLFGAGKLSYDKPVVRESYEDDKL